MMGTNWKFTNNKMAKSTKTETVPIEDLIFDDKNANRGNERGGELIENSFNQFGAGRSVLLDKNNRLISGNKSTEKAIAAGIQKVIIVESDGSELIAVRRKDIDLDSKKGREMAIADNAAAKANIDFDFVVIEDLETEWGFDAKEWGVGDTDFEKYQNEGIGGAPDYSDKNKELNLDDFEDVMEFKFKVSKDQYFDIQERLNVVMSKQNVDTKEDALFELLNFYERHGA